MLTRIGKYEILSRLGQGAMGEVYLARDPLIGREVAIKTIAAAHAQGEESRERFLREARAAGTLNHPNLVTIHEFGEDGGMLFLVMEYVPGEDLHALIALKGLPPKEILEVLAQVCDGLGFAHSKGVLHRDIKPGNIRVARPGGKLQAKVMDFGIARITGSDFTGTGTLLGTFGYMAPEYIQTGRPDFRSDLFAVGVILYEALAGDRPFKGDTTATVLYRIVHDTPPPIEAAAIEGVSPSVRAILAIALAKDPADRFQSAEEMARALRAAKDPTWRGLGEGAATLRAQAEVPPTTRLEKTAGSSPPTPRRVWPWLAAGLVAAAATVAFWPKPAARAMAPAEAPAPAPRVDPAGPAEVKAEPPQKPAVKPAPPPKVVAAAPPPPVAPKAPEIGSMDEASAALDRDPKAALRFLDRFLTEDPRNVRAFALKMVAHYHLDDLEGFRAAAREARDRGIHRKALMMVPRFRQMALQEAENPKLPRGEREHLLDPLPANDGRKPPLKRPRY
jgi:serine/threonine-protein kinase